MRFLTSLLVGALVALPAASFATEGGLFTSWSTSGRTTEVYYLCDGNHAASEPCTAFDLRALPSSTPTQKRSPPTEIQFVLHRQAAACTPTVTVVGQMASGTDALRVDHTIQALLGAATSSYTPPIVPLFPVYSATVSADAQCTDLEVLIVLHYDNN